MIALGWHVRGGIMGVAVLIGMGFLVAHAMSPHLAMAQGTTCGSYPTQAAAQAAYRANPTGLASFDKDKDGIACEGYPCPCDYSRTGAAAPPAAQPAAPPIISTPGPAATPTPLRTAPPPPTARPTAPPTAAPSALPTTAPRHIFTAQPSPSPVLRQQAKFDRVESDGSIKVKVGDDTRAVRLAGVLLPAKGTDAGKEAQKMIDQTLKKKSVELERDVTHQENSQMVRHVWVDGDLLSEKMIEYGLLEIDPGSRDQRYGERLKQAQRASGPGMLAVSVLRTLVAKEPQPFRIYSDAGHGDWIHLDTEATSKDDLKAICQAVSNLVYAQENARFSLTHVRIYNVDHKQKIERKDQKGTCK